ncbi:hypothetical protein IFR05_009889 [Cadophora sp. M221]|nr:hypothetical protein IFR05_009889 [Cadophora sp. M221]
MAISSSVMSVSETLIYASSSLRLSLSAIGQSLSQSSLAFCDSGDHNTSGFKFPGIKSADTVLDNCRQYTDVENDCRAFHGRSRAIHKLPINLESRDDLVCHVNIVTHKREHSRRQLT